MGQIMTGAAEGDFQAGMLLPVLAEWMRLAVRHSVRKGSCRVPPQDHATGVPNPPRAEQPRQVGDYEHRVGRDVR